MTLELVLSYKLTILNSATSETECILHAFISLKQFLSLKCKK